MNNEENPTTLTDENPNLNKENDYIAFGSLIKGDDLSNIKIESSNPKLSSTDNINPDTEKFPIKTPYSIQYNNNEIEIFSSFDDQPKCLFWIVIILIMILFFPIFVIAFILQNTKCPRYMISRVYIYKKDNQIIIKRKGNNSCYCLYCASHSYFNVNDIKYFSATQKNSEYDYDLKVIDNNYNEDIILPVSGISEEAKNKILDFLNSLIQN